MSLLYKYRQPNCDASVKELFLDSDTSQDYCSRGRFFAPEWYRQSAVVIVWPTSDTPWNYMPGEITHCYVRLACEIASRQPLLVVTSCRSEVESVLRKYIPSRLQLAMEIFECPVNDTWARDTAFLSMITPDGIELLDFRFNGWGGKFEAAADNAMNGMLAKGNILHGVYRDVQHFILEGGSVETDGKGTILTTESCLLATNRNNLPREAVEAVLHDLLGADRVLWLSHGALEGDDTDGHIDTLARMCPGNVIAYVKCYNPDDSHFLPLEAMERELRGFRNAEGEPYKLVPLPLPRPVYDRDTSERLPATYANYLVMNNAVLMPSYGQPECDSKAARALGQIFPDREIVCVPSAPLLRQHGSLHCSTMQLPWGVFQPEKNNL